MRPVLVSAVSVLLVSFATLVSAAEPGWPSKAQVIDLTWTISDKAPYWPGDNYHPFKAEVSATLAEDGVYSRNYCSPEHLGTHIDAPNHFEKGQTSVDGIEVGDLIAPAVVFDISTRVERDADTLLTMDDIRAWEKNHGPVQKGAIILLRTGWAKRIDDFHAYKNADETGRLHFPSFSVEAARYFVHERQARGLGIDTLSIDPGLSTDFGVHHVVNGAGRYGLENVANLELLPPTGAVLVVAPMKIEGGTGGQTRIFAILP